jgi:hypothetical protein
MSPLPTISPSRIAEWARIEWLKIATCVLPERRTADVFGVGAFGVESIAQPAPRAVSAAAAPLRSQTVQAPQRAIELPPKSEPGRTVRSSGLDLRTETRRVPWARARRGPPLHTRLPPAAVYQQFPQLQVEIAHSVRAHSAVLDGEIVCLADDGRSVFNRLLFRRDWPQFVAFDLLAIDGEDLRDRPRLERKRRLRRIMPRLDSRLVYMDHVVGRGSRMSGSRQK